MRVWSKSLLDLFNPPSAIIFLIFSSAIWIFFVLLKFFVLDFQRVRKNWELLVNISSTSPNRFLAQIKFIFNKNWNLSKMKKNGICLKIYSNINNKRIGISTFLYFEDFKRNFWERNFACAKNPDSRQKVNLSNKERYRFFMDILLYLF